MIFNRLPSAVLIIAALCVAIYFIVADAIDKKAEACLLKYFQKEGLLEKYNVHVDLDGVYYSNEDCQSYVDRARRKTQNYISELTNITNCMREQFEGPQLESLMLKGVLERYNRDATGVIRSVFGSTQAHCRNQTLTQ